MKDVQIPKGSWMRSEDRTAQAQRSAGQTNKQPELMLNRITKADGPKSEKKNFLPYYS
jgi:hypothetical protein